jgi:hypothetical protein
MEWIHIFWISPFTHFFFIVINLFGLRAARGPFGLAHIFCGFHRAGLKSPDVNSGWNFKAQAREKFGPFGPAHSARPILTALPKPLDVLNHAKAILLWDDFSGLYSKTIRCT